MDNTFANKLNALKQTRNLSVQELAQRAGVSSGLISGLLHGYRIIGEKTARKIAAALNLQGEELEEFVHLALNNGCTEKVLNASKAFPSEVLNLVAGELNALGISPDRIKRFVRKSDDTTAALYLDNGERAYINVEVAIV
jgi:transcriptional regulator with XRE-family HTH domain